MANHRLFVAIRPPRPLREQLLALMGGVPEARWQDDDQLHLTLRFIGEVDRHLAEDVAAALGSISHPPLAVALSGVGQFGAGRDGRSIWAGVGPHDELARLARKVNQALARAGIAPESRAFLPHVTLARLGRGTGPVEPFIARHAGLASEPVTVTSFALFESQLGNGGASYQMVERYPFR